MKKILVLAAVALSVGSALANDTGVSAIKVSEIKMREIKRIENGKEVVRKITTPNFKILISGGEAENLMKILPPISTIASPSREGSYGDSFKELGIYNDASDGVTSKAVTISCSDAKAVYDAKTRKEVIQKTGKTECVIQIQPVDADLGIAEILGDTTTYEPPVCK